MLPAERFDADGEVVNMFPERNRSPDQNANAPIMNRSMQRSIRNFADYVWDSPLMTPFNFKHHRNVPPTLIQVTGLDPWRDSGIIYAEDLGKDGVPVKMDAYPGLPHCWWQTFPQLKASQKWLKATVEGIQWLLDRGQDPQSRL